MTLTEIPEVRYAMSSGDVRVAYEVLGSGDVDVVFALGFVPNMEMSREVCDRLHVRPAGLLG
jgi:hypothetical protein